MDSSEDDDNNNHVELELSQAIQGDAASKNSSLIKNRNHELDPILPGASSRSRVTTNKDNDNMQPSHATIIPGTASQAQVATNIVVSFVGAGVLGIPNAFSRAGWLLGFSTLCIVSALNVYAMLLLPKVRHALIQTYNHEPHECRSFGDVGRCILGSKGETLVNMALGISQAGFATAYIIFISANIHATWHISRQVVCLACIPGLTLLVQFQDVKSLSPFSLLANISNFCALFAVLLQDYESYDPHNDAVHPVRWSGFLYVVAVTIYSMEGVGLILSLESSGKQRSKFPSLLTSMLTAITLFMAFFGTAGYWAFGEDTKAPITLNLGTHWSATFVKCALCVGLYFTYPVMMFPIWAIAERSCPQTEQDVRTRVLFRCSVVFLSTIVAYSMPDFGKFLSLVGSSICTILGFILPCYFHLVVMKEELLLWQRYLDYFLISAGAIIGTLGTIESCQAMMAGSLEGSHR